MSDDIQSLDDVDTEIIQRDGWRLDKMITGHIENTMPSYEEAVLYAENKLQSHEVALRSVVNKQTVFWEVYVKNR